MTPGGPPRWPHVLGTAAFLACSWTWCIGMFLPILLLRDFGPWAFPVFAIPNVVGAAAMGWVMTRESSVAFVARHSWACGLFSAATIAFQFFFLMWFGLAMGGLGNGGPVHPATIIVLLASAPLLALVFKPDKPAYALIGSAALWLTSLALGFAAWLRGGLTTDALHWTPALAAPDLLYLAPVCCLGFLLCPYLDLTFHRSRQSLSRSESRLAFTLGFGLMFLVMILMTVGYAAMFYFIRGREPALVQSAAARLISLHILLQLLFTMIAHIAVALPRAKARGGFSGIRAWAIALPAAFLLYGAVMLWPFVVPPRAGLSPGEVTYRLFMGLYGLAFPAYVYICALPTGRGPARHSGISGRLGRAKLATFAAAVALAAPAFWMGFIERETWWLLPGVAIVLLARIPASLLTPAPTPERRVPNA